MANFMACSPSDTSKRSGSKKKIESLLWSPTFRHQVHKPLIIYWIQSIPQYPVSLKSISILSFNLRLCLQSDLFHSGSLTNILYAFRISLFSKPISPAMILFCVHTDNIAFKCFRFHKRTVKCFVHHWTRQSHEEDLDSEHSFTRKMLALKSEHFVLIHVLLWDVLVTSVTVLQLNCDWESKRLLD